MKPGTLMAWFLSAAVVLAVPAATQERRLPRYIVTDLGTFGATLAFGQGINNDGLLDGIYADVSSPPVFQHAFVWQAGVVTDLGTLGGPNSGVGVFPFGEMPNERGQIAGSAESSDIDPLAEGFCNFLLASPVTNNVCLPFIWQNGVMTALPTLGGTNGGATEINNRAQVVGEAETTTIDPTCASPHLEFEPVIWEKGVVHQLPTVGGDPDGGVDAINDLGQAVGATGSCITGFHAVLWEQGLATDLGNLGGAFFFEATAINNKTQVVGFSDLPGDTVFHAFLWQDGLIADLGTLPGDSFSWGSAINNIGQVVGTSCDATFTICRGFLWENGTMTDLNTLTPAGSPFLLEAIGINDPGQITGVTASGDAYLATPGNGGAPSESTAPAERGRRTEAPKPVLSENIRKLFMRGPGPWSHVLAP